MNKTIWTIGHSTLSSDTFIALLLHYKIELVVDVRTLPGSTKFPQFNQDELAHALQSKGIDYLYIKQLGGLRKRNKESENIAWRNQSFRNYADYMETADFRAGIQELEEIALKKRVAMMCAEAVWWRCHRSMIADYLKVQGWEVIHILSMTNSKIHPYTSAASIIDGQLTYKIAQPLKLAIDK